MAKTVTIAGATYSDVPSVDIPLSSGGTAKFVDTSDANASAADVLSGKTAYVNGSLVSGSLATNTYYTGTSEPASSLGSDGDLYLVVS
jgi:hypothetical protein